MKGINQILLSGVGLAAIITGAAPAMAQDSSASATAVGPQEDSEDSNSNEIVVTAQKREQNLQDVPISMEVVSGEKLQDLGVNDFASLAAYVPNVAVQTTAGNDVIYVRGFCKLLVRSSGQLVY